MIARIFAPLAMKVAGAIIAALLAFVVALLIQIHGLPVFGGGLISRLEKMTELRRTEADNHRQTKANFIAATAEALRLEKARLARVKAEQERINHDRETSANARLAALRDQRDRLLSQARTGAASAAGGQPVPGLPLPAFGADAATSENGLSLTERYECSVTAVQLDELISWVDAQAKVKVND